MRGVSKGREALRAYYGYLDNYITYQEYREIMYNLYGPRK